MKNQTLFQKAIGLEQLSVDEGIFLYEQSSTAELIFLADQIRKQHHQSDQVSWIIDRNVNITNVCICACQFCNFSRSKNHADAYITTIDQYKEKIEELLSLGGNQLLLQGGLHPDLDVHYYIDLFKELKQLYPDIKLHALSPTEIVYLAKKENCDYNTILSLLINAGLDSLPGGGAERLINWESPLLRR
jgi:cyclic dehypoxanthinyl futalosine synthase